MGSNKAKKSSTKAVPTTAPKPAQRVTKVRNTTADDPMSIISVIAACITFASVSINLSQICLAPVYGSVPSSLWHWHVIGTSFAVGWVTQSILKHTAPTVQLKSLLPLSAAWIPLAQCTMFPYSSKWGAELGPLVTEAATLGPLIALTSATIAEHVQKVNSGLTAIMPGFMATAAPMLASWGGLCLMKQVAGNWLQYRIGSSLVYTSTVMELILVGLHAAFFSPPWHALLILPVLFHSAFMNPHVMSPMATSALNRTLMADGWMLLDRREGMTGYISVLESIDKGFRAMRCGHSLLGGEWVASDTLQVAEPIFSVFVLLEAVRLIQTEASVKDSDASALVIGLGIGTTPSALVKHGIDTVVVEIDPVVHEFAQKYFDLKENNAPVVQDAVKVTSQLAKADTEIRKFEYIVHDVFTGGVEPVDLFTLEFLQSLKDLLKPDGVIAINYAGDMALPAPKLIIRTILSIFPSCRIFREGLRNQEFFEKTGMDFTNMVIFCKKSSSKAITFRRAQPGDFLGSQTRAMFLQPQYEVNVTAYLNHDRDAATTLLMQNNTGQMNEWHRASALGHWEVMRKVVPDKIWELW